jgi:hypothetical protein
MNEELASGFLQDLIVGRIKKLVLEKLAEIQAAFLSGDVAAMESILKWLGENIGYQADLTQLGELIAAVKGRDPATILREVGETFIAASKHFEKEAVRTMGAVSVSDELGASIEDVAAMTGVSVAANAIPIIEPKPEFFMEAIAVIGLVINIARWIRERRNPK